jgi:hypothetical protein
MLKSLSAFIVSMTLLLVGVPFALLGVIGVSDTFFEMTRRESLRYGLYFLFIAAIVWGAAIVLSWWGTGHEVPTRFSLSSLMIGMTFLAIILGLIAAL